MKILVTGSMGTLGSRVMARDSSVHDLFGLDLTHSNRSNHIRCDIADYRQLEHAIAFYSPDLILNLAAEFGRKNGEEYYEQVWRSNVIGLKNLLKLQTLFHFKLIHASSSEVYGELNKAEIVEEDFFKAIPTNDYALSKVINECQIKNHREQNQQRVMILRLFNAYGPGEYYTPYRSVVCLFIYRMLHDLPIIVYKNYHRVFMYVEDLVDTLWKSFDHYHDNVFNIGGREYCSCEELYERLKLLIPESKSNVIYVEEDKHNVVNKKPNIDKCIWHQPDTMLDVGLPKTVDWMRQCKSQLSIQ